MKNNYAKIDIMIDSAEDLYSKYSIDTNPTLNPEVESFINSNIKDSKVKEKFKFNIHTPNELSEAEQLNYARVIKKHYNALVQESMQMIMRYLLISVILLAVGLFFGTMLIISKASVNPIVVILFEVLTWVFVWEFIDIIAFIIPVKQFKTKRLKKVANAKFNFVVTK